MKFLIAFFICLVLLNSHITSQIATKQNDILQNPSPAVTIIIPDSYSSELSDTALQAFQSVQQPIEKKLGITLLIPAKIYLCKNHTEVEQIVGEKLPLWMFGVAVPSRYLIAVNLQKMGPPENLLAPVIRHETVHLYLGNWERYHGQSLPLWFNEGLSEWFSGAMHFSYSEDMLDSIVFDRVIRFSALENHFPKNAVLASQAYMQSLSMIQYLTHQYGEECLKQILDHYKVSDTFDEALEATFNKNLEELQEDWKQFITPNPWFAWMWRLRHFVSLFTIAALLAIIAFYRQHRRNKALLLVMREQERLDQERLDQEIRNLQHTWKNDWLRQTDNAEQSAGS